MCVWPSRCDLCNVNSGLVKPSLIDRGVSPFSGNSDHFWREHPPNKGTGLLILGQHYSKSYFSGDLDVHRGYGILTHGHVICALQVRDWEVEALALA